MQIFLAEVAMRKPDQNIIIVLNGAGLYKSKFNLPVSLKLYFLPPPPEHNPQEIIWHRL
jgi:hypothetical protein